MGSILHIFGVMMASPGTEYYQILLAQGVCSAIGISGSFQPGMNKLCMLLCSQSNAGWIQPSLLRLAGFITDVVLPLEFSLLAQALVVSSYL